MTAADEQDKTDVELSGHDGVSVPVRTLYYDRTGEREMHIVCSPDRMRVYMKIVPGEKFAGITRESIIGHIYSAGVTYGILDTGIDLLAALQSGPSPFSGYWQVAMGDPMRQGEDGSVEFHVQPTSAAPRYDEDASGGVDFKQLNPIENCFAGQRVASILPPGPGRSGKDVFGQVLRPVAGAPAAIQQGPGIVVSPGGRDFTSEVEGRLVFQDGVLSVSPVLEITGDIDYSVGNIDFVGKVVVKGSLPDGFYVNAKRGLELTGEVGAARISSEGDVKIVGGIKSKGAAIIACRDLSAHYIDDASIEATGNVIANNEIINSSVKALGRVSVTGGAIIGGEVCGFRGVEADTLGSDMGVSTWVLAGLNWTEENRKGEIRAMIAEYLDRIQSSKILLDPLLADKEATARLGSEQKSMLSELIAELRDLRENLDDLLKERAGLDNRSSEGQVDQINVRKTVFQGVSVRFGRAEGQFHDNVKGPVSLTLNVADGSVATGDFRELPPIEAERAAEPAAAPGIPAPPVETGDVGMAAELSEEPPPQVQDM